MKSKGLLCELRCVAAICISSYTAMALHASGDLFFTAASVAAGVWYTVQLAVCIVKGVDDE